MKISLDWLNTYLAPACPAQQIDPLLTGHGFPIEDTVKHDSGAAAGDTMFDVEVTSNRGDCLSHVGVAREVAAATGATLNVPACELPDATGEPVDSLTSVDNREQSKCPVYTARVITGVKVGPSPDWLVARLEAVGLRAVNNVVDITNFVLLELGQPLHAFDMNKLAGRRIVVRNAEKGEAFTAIDGSKHKLRNDMLVIADEEKPIAIAGVMGGLDSEVGESTTDILLESAIFDPLSVRTTSRALKLNSDSSFRFERGMNPLGVELASRRAAALIVELAGGTLADGVIRVGEDEPTLATLDMRVSRCNQLLGLELSAQQQADLLNKIGLNAKVQGSGDSQRITTTVPSFRLDLKREVDLIEEVARLHGLDVIPTHDKIEIATRSPQDSVEARRTLSRVLVSHGYHETITFSFVHPDQASAFLPEGAGALMLDDERKKGEPMLRPSVLPSLLACRKLNQDAGNTGVRLFESASVWSVNEHGANERRTVTLLRDAEDAELAMRESRGAIDELVEAMGGAVARDWVSIEPTEDAKVYAAAGRVMLQGREIGRLGLVSPKVCDGFDVRTPQVAVELDEAALMALYPPRPVVSALPKFPAIERDLSLILDEAVAWRQVQKAIESASPALLDGLEFLGVYRGKPIAKGKKSVSLRMLFRDPEATLRHEQVDPQVAAVVGALKEKVGAELRG